MHCSVRNLNLSLQKSAKKFNFITPRDFLDFIKHFVDLQHEKKTELSELQEHLEIGIQKLKNTEKSVQELGDTLKQYDMKLIAQKKHVKEKMDALTKESQKVNNKKEVAETTKVKLEEKQEFVSERKVIVETDLGKAEPALVAALASVQGVKSSDITELQRYAKPPERVRIALEPVVALLLNADKTPEWKMIQKEL
jgi:dynein heavy chain 1